MKPLDLLRVSVLAFVACVLQLSCFKTDTSSPPSSEATPGVEEYWYVMLLEGERSGWSHMRRSEKDGRVTSEQELSLSMKRLNQTIEVKLETKSVEGLGGEPVSHEVRQRLSSQEATTRVEYGGKEMVVTQRSGQQESKKTLPLIEGEWFMPDAARRFVEKEIAAGKKLVELNILDDSTGTRAVGTTVKVDRRETIEVFGKDVPAIRQIVTSTLLPGIDMIQYSDERGVPLKTEVDMGFVRLNMVLADKSLALGDLSPPEIMASSFVKLDTPIPDARRLRRAVYEIRANDGQLADIPETSVQKFERIDATRGKLRVDLDASFGSEAAPELEHSVAIDGRDPKIVALMKQATKTAGEDPAARAEALRRWVHGYIDAKDLSVGFASASEVAQTATGDCTEHGVLLAALLRAAGLPSRVATGLIYVPNIRGHRQVFGYHMWTQFWHPDQKRWVDVDATLPEATPFDAAHITLGVTALAGGVLDNDMVAMIPLIGRLEIVSVSF